jgi:hypothetical protein
MSVSGLGMFTTAADQVAALRASAGRLENAGVGLVLTAATQDPFATDKLPGMALAFDDGSNRIYTVPHAPYAEVRGGDCHLRIDGRLRQTADCAAPAMLVRRELSLAGWHAWINGGKAAIRDADGMFQSVALPAGPVEIVWEYSPPHSRTMALLSALGAATIIGFGYRARRVVAKGLSPGPAGNCSFHSDLSRSLGRQPRADTPQRGFDPDIGKLCRSGQQGYAHQRATQLGMFRQ